MITNELNRLLRKQVLRKLCTAQTARIARQLDALVVVPQVTRKMVVSMPLAIVTEEQIETLSIGIAAGAGKAESPFADGGCRVPRLLQPFCHRKRLAWNRQLAFRLVFTIVANVGVSRVLSRHQHTPRWCDTPGLRHSAE